jgi:hypothetical protein
MHRIVAVTVVSASRIRWILPAVQAGFLLPAVLLLGGIVSVFAIQRAIPIGIRRRRNRHSRFLTGLEVHLPVVHGRACTLRREVCMHGWSKVGADSEQLASPGCFGGLPFAADPQASALCVHSRDRHLLYSLNSQS